MAKKEPENVTKNPTTETRKVWEPTKKKLGKNVLKKTGKTAKRDGRLISEVRFRTLRPTTTRSSDH